MPELEQAPADELPQDRRARITAELDELLPRHRLVPGHHGQGIDRLGIEPHEPGPRLQHAPEPGELRPQPHHPAVVLRGNLIGTVVGAIPLTKVHRELVDLLRTHAPHQPSHRTARQRLAPWEPHEQERLEDRGRAHAAGIVGGARIVEVGRRIDVHHAGRRFLRRGMRIGRPHHRRERLGELVDRETAVGRGCRESCGGRWGGLLAGHVLGRQGGAVSDCLVADRRAAPAGRGAPTSSAAFPWCG